MENFQLYFVERFGHGQHERNSLLPDQKVTIEDDDFWFFVYECDSDKMADDIANWFVTHFDIDHEIVKHDLRSFRVERVEI